MTKAEIIDAVYEKVGGFSKKDAAEIVEAVFDTMKEVLADGEKIKISGFGNFVVRDKAQRIGRNPQTGDPIPISARRVLTFKPSQVLKSVLNPEKEQLKKEASEKLGLEGEVEGGDTTEPVDAEVAAVAPASAPSAPSVRGSDADDA